MALWRPSAIVSAVSGTIGGVNFAHGPGGRYLRAPARIPAKSSRAQQSARAIMPSINHAWKTATADSRLQWQALASTTPTTDRLGQQRPTTGRSLHAAWNIYRAQCGLAIQTATPPAYGTAAAPWQINDAFPSPGHISVEVWFTPGTGSTIYTLLYGAVRFARGTLRAHPNWKFVAAQVPDFGSNKTTFDLTTQWSSLFGEPIIGQTYWLAARMLYNQMLASPLTIVELTY